MSLVGAFDDTGFFHQEAIAGAGLGEFFKDDLFSAQIRSADKVAGAFTRNLKVFHLAEIACEFAGCLAGSANHDIDDWAIEGH